MADDKVWKFEVTCTRCKYTQSFPVHTTWKAFEAAIGLIAKLNTVKNVNDLIVTGWEKHCQCPPKTKVRISVPSWFREAFQAYKNSWEEYKRTHPL